MTSAEVAAALAGVVLFGGALRAAPVIWRFVVAAARLPHMTEQIWAEFGRNGGSTTRDRIEAIARDVGEAARSAARTAELLSAHTASDMTSFAAIASTDALITARMTTIEATLERLSARIEGER